MTLLLRALLRLFPASFRDRFGAEMWTQIREDRRRARRRGLLAALRIDLAIALDLARGALAEWLAPSWAGTGRHDERRR